MTHTKKVVVTFDHVERVRQKRTPRFPIQKAPYEGILGTFKCAKMRVYDIELGGLKYKCQSSSNIYPN